MNFKLNDKVYNFLKWLAMIVMPAIGSLYFGLSGIWGFPYAEQIVGTITLVDTFLVPCLVLAQQVITKGSESNGRR